MKKLRFLVLFLFVSSFSVGIEKQLARDREMMREFGRKMARLPVFKFPAPHETGFDGNALRRYEAVYRKINEMNGIAIELNELGRELSANADGGTFFSLLEIDALEYEKKIGKAVGRYNRWVELHNSMTKEKMNDVFNSISTFYSLTNFSGLISVHNTTFSQIEHEIEALPELEKLERIPTDLQPETEDACVLRFSSGNHTEIFGELPCYLRYYHPQMYLVFTKKPVFVSREILQEAISVETTSSLPSYALLFSSLSIFTEGAKRYTENKKKELFYQVEEVEEELSRLEKQIKVFNNSGVLHALQIASRTGIIRSGESTPEWHAAKLARALATTNGSLGKRARAYVKGLEIVGRLKRNIKSYRSVLDENFGLLEAACKLYREKSRKGVMCEFETPDDVELLARNTILAYMAYLEARGEERKILREGREYLLSKIHDLELFIYRVSPFLNSRAVGNFGKELKERRAEANLMERVEEFEKINRELEDLEDDVCLALITENGKEAEELRRKFAHLHFLASAWKTNLSVPHNLFSKPHLEDMCVDVLRLMENKQSLDQFELSLKSVRDSLSSNLPTSVHCLTPLLGVKFTASCIINATNPWPEPLKSASSSVTLPFPVDSIDGRAVVGGDIANLESLVGVDRNVRVKWKNIKGGAVILLKYKTFLPPPAVEKVKESVNVSQYTVTYLIKANCPTENAYAILPHPFSTHVMHSSSPYWLYNSTHIALRIPCGSPFSVTFSGQAYEAVEKKGTTLLRKIVDTELPVFVEVSGDPNTSFSVSGSKKLVLLEDELALRDVEVKSPSEDTTSNFSLSQEFKLGDESKIRMEENSRVFGCLPEFIVKEVRARYYVPRARCVEVNYSRARELFERGEQEEAVKIYEAEKNRENAYLSTALKYREDARIAIEELKGMLNNPLTRRIAGKYLKEAVEAYKIGDYISAIYYARFGILKVPVNLETPVRVILAIVVVTGAFLMSRREEKEEELI